MRRDVPRVMTRADLLLEDISRGDSSMLKVAGPEIIAG